MANMEEAVSGGQEKEVKGGGEDIGVLILEVQLEMLLFESFLLVEI